VAQRMMKYKGDCPWKAPARAITWWMPSFTTHHEIVSSSHRLDTIGRSHKEMTSNPVRARRKRRWRGAPDRSSMTPKASAVSSSATIIPLPWRSSLGRPNPRRVVTECDACADSAERTRPVLRAERAVESVDEVIGSARHDIEAGDDARRAAHRLSRLRNCVGPYLRATRTVDAARARADAENRRG